MKLLWPQSGTALLSAYVYMEVGVTCIGVWISYFSESAAHLKKKMNWVVWKPCNMVITLLILSEITNEYLPYIQWYPRP